MKKTEKSINGTSFHDVVINSSINELTQLLGEPSYYNNSGDDKVNVEWDCELEDGRVVSLYDWKEYRPVGKDEVIEFHIGGFSKLDTIDARLELLKALKNN
jgi:hypothetical protein